MKPGVDPAHLIPEVTNNAPELKPGVDPAHVPPEADGELGAPAGRVPGGDDVQLI